MVDLATDERRPAARLEPWQPAAATPPASGSGAEAPARSEGSVEAPSAPFTGGGKDGGAAEPGVAASDRPVPEPSHAPAVAAPPFDAAAADRMVWRAGRWPLAGTPAAAAGELERARRDALAEVRRRMELSGLERARWVGHLGGILGSEDRADPLWCAAARVAADLRLYSFAGDLARELETGRPPLRREAALQALHGLYGRWFPESDQAEPFLEDVVPGAGTELLVDSVLEEERVAVAQLFKTFEHDPSAAFEALGSPNPLVRTGAARALGDAVATGRLEARPVLEALFRGLRVEADPRAFHAVLGAALVPLESAPVDSPMLGELRGILSSVAVDRADGRALPVAQALARLPWSTAADAPPADSLLEGVASIGRVLERLAAQHDLPRDPDVLVGTLQALLSLCDRAKGTPLAPELRRSPARQPVFSILQDASLDEVVRAAAVAGLAPLALPEDWPLLLDVLRGDDGSPALAHALLGALRSVLTEFEAENPASDEVLSRVAELTGARDPDLRRRAFAILADERLAPLVAGRLDPTFLLERLSAEEVPDLSNQILGLLARYGMPGSFDEFVGLERFDALVDDGAVVPQVTRVLRRLADRRVEETWHAADRLATAHAPTTYALRLAQALQLCAELDREAAQELAPEEHLAVLRWAWELHVAGVDLIGATDVGAAFLTRLVDLHLVKSAPAVGTDGWFDEGTRSHLQGVVLAQLVVAGVRADKGGEVESSFQRALEYPGAFHDEDFVRRVKRDLARYHAARGESAKAMREFRELIGEDALENSDLRTAAHLNRAIGGDGPAGRRATAPESFDWIDHLIHRPSWASEPTGVRLQDLRDLAQMAQDSGSPKRMRRFVNLLEDLPPEPQREDPPGRAWTGLARDPAWLAELAVLRDRVHEALAATQPAGDPETAPADGEG